MTVTINIPSQLPALTGNANLFLRVNAGANGIEWAATAGGGITIGTTAIASGTVGRVLFEGAGNVVQQSSNFFWDNTNGRLGIRVATPTASLEVLGAAPSGTTQSFAVHNSTGTSNALVVRDDGFVGVGVTGPGNGGGRLRVAGDMVADINQTGILNMGVYTQSGNANERAQLTLRAGNSGTATTYTVTSVPNNAAGTSIVDHVVAPSVGLGGNSSLRFTLGNGSISSFVFRFDVSELMRIRRNSVLIGTSTDVPSSILTLESTTKGFLPPRMTAAQRGAISSPANGVLVIQTDGGAGVEGLWRYELSTTSWVRIG